MTLRPDSLGPRHPLHKWREKLRNTWLRSNGSLPRRLIREHEIVVSQSGMFNAEWYTRGGRADGSIRHYLQHGVSEGRDPHPIFRTRFYLEQNPDVAASGINPLAHYLIQGAAEGRDPHPLFSTRFYLSKNPDVAEAGLNPLIHYLSHGAAEGRDPHPWFDGRFYRSRTPDAASLHINPLWHYLTCGALSAGDPHPCFSNRFYHDQYPDAASSGINLLVHYLTVGIREGRLPCPNDNARESLEAARGRSRAGSGRPAAGDASTARRHRRILILDNCDPPANRRLTMGIAGNLYRLGFSVSLVPTNLSIDPGYKEQLAKLGIDVAVATPLCVSATDYLACHGADFDIVYLRDVDAADELLVSIRAGAPGATVIFHPTAWRSSLTMPGTGRRREDPITVDNADPELTVAARAELVVAGSSTEVDALRARFPNARIGFFPAIPAGNGDALAVHDADLKATLPCLLPILSEAKALPLEAWRDHCAALAPLPLPTVAPSAAVDVSIIIPVFDRWHAAKGCLNSILETTPGRDITFEVILADDGSSDDTIDAAKQFPGLRIVRSETSHGFVEACNNAARQARGRYLLFVDGNSVALTGWLASLFSTAERDDRTAIVGSKILSLDGRIRNGGSTLFRDGSVLDIGRGADRYVAVLNAEREADFVSSESILVRRSFWERSGGFDGSYGDLGYTSADLGMTARRLGFRVVYQPASEIVLSARSSGRTSLLVSKWREILTKDHLPPVSWPLAMSGAERVRSPGKRSRGKPDASDVLYFSPIPSHPVSHGNRSSVYRFARWMQQAGHRVHFALLSSGDYSDRDAKDMAAAWDTFDIIPFSKQPLPSGADVPFDGAYEEGLGEKVRALCSKHDIDVVICSYIFQSKLLEFVPAYIVKVIDTHDKMGDRYDMLRANGLPLEFFSCTPEEEGAYLKRADIVLARREEEARYFDEVSGRRSAIVIPHFEPARFADKTWDSLRHVGIVASANNVNLKMVHDCLVAIDRRLDGKPCPFVLHVAGEVRGIVARLPADQQQAFDKPWLDMVGFVDDIGTFYEDMDLILSPVTVGTGINVKTVQAMAFGMPLLTTQCGSKGIESGDPRHGHDGMPDLVESLFEIVETPAELRRLAEVSRSTYSKFHDQAEQNMRSIFLHEKLSAGR